MFRTFSLVFGLSLVGCATNQYDAEIEAAKYDYAIKAQQEQNKPIFTMECPETGCKFKVLVVNNPNKSPIAIPKSTNGFDVANRVLDTATQVVPWIVTGKIATTAIKNAGDAINNSVSNSNNDQSNQSEATTDSNNDFSVANTDSYNTDSSDNSTDSSDHSSVQTTTTTTDNSDNSNHSDNSDNSNHSDNSDNSIIN